MQIYRRSALVAAAIDRDIALGDFMQRPGEFDTDDAFEAIPRRQHKRTAFAGTEIDKQILARIDPDSAHDGLEDRKLNRFITRKLGYVLTCRAKSSDVHIGTKGRYAKASVEALLSPDVVVMFGAEPLFSSQLSNCIDRRCHSYKGSAVQTKVPVLWLEFKKN